MSIGAGDGDGLLRPESGAFGSSEPGAKSCCSTDDDTAVDPVEICAPCPGLWSCPDEFMLASSVLAPPTLSGDLEASRECWDSRSSLFDGSCTRRRRWGCQSV